MALPSSGVLVTQEVAEVLETGAPEARVTQVLAEVLRGGGAAVWLTQAVVEVLRSTTSTQGVVKSLSSVRGLVQNATGGTVDTYDITARAVTWDRVQAVSPNVFLGRGSGSGDVQEISQSLVQPADGDLTALAALTGTNTIYYRSAADTWTAVTIGSGLAFAGGSLTATAGGGTTILDGAGPPTNATGAAGNYYEDTTNGVLYGPKSASGSEQRITVTNAPTSNATGELGVRVQFARGGVITRLRSGVSPTSADTITLHVWNDDAGNALLATIPDTHVAGTGAFEVTLSPPIAVPAGAIRTFSMGTAGSTTPRLVATNNPVTNTTDCTFLAYRSAASGNYPSTTQTTFAYFVEPVFESDSIWPVAVEQIPQFTSTIPGMVPLSGGGTANFLRADGTWTTPPVTGIGADTATIDLTLSAGLITGIVIDGSITLAKMASVATSTVFYRKTAATGAPEVQTLATLKTDLGLTGTNSGDQTITLTGDVTGSGTGSFAATISAGVVTYAKIQNVTASRLLGRGSSSGPPEEITVGTGLTMTGATLSSTVTAGADEVTIAHGPDPIAAGLELWVDLDTDAPTDIAEQAQDAVGGILVDSATIDFTYTDATPAITAIVKDASITPAKMDSVGYISVLGRASSGTGPRSDVLAAFDNTFLARAAGALGWGYVPGQILAYAVVETAQSTASGTAVDLATVQSTTFTLPNAADVWILAFALCNCTAVSSPALTLDVDGTDYGYVCSMPIAGAGFQITALKRLSLASGSHTIKLQFATNAGTATFSGRSLIVYAA